MALGELAPGARPEEADGGLEQIERAVEGAVVAPVLHDAAGVRDGRAVAGEQSADLGEAQFEHDVSQVHPDLARQGDARVTSVRRPEGQGIDAEGVGDGVLQDMTHDLLMQALWSASAKYTLGLHI